MTRVDLLITGAQVYTDLGVVKDAAVAIQNNKIQAVDCESKFSAKEILRFPSDYHLVPGFIDLHIHGAAGSDVMDGDFSALEVISQALAREGTTSFLATTMTAAPTQIENALLNIRHFMQKQQAELTGAKILGAHLEGPFVSPKKVGAQRTDNLLLPNTEYIQRWQEQTAHVIKLITLAPELPGSIEFIQFLKLHHIVASIGHTDATYAETSSAIQAGCAHVTHLFNAMRGIHQREPGVVTAALLSDNVSAELIVDGVHLHPAIVQLILKSKQADKIVLVTDAMRAKCMRDGAYDLGGQRVEVKEGVARLVDGTLAGSTLTMPAAIANIIKFTGIDLHTAIKFAAENPARVLNIFQQKGSITPQKDADLVVLDNHLNVVMTICEGRVTESRPSGSVIAPAKFALLV